MKLGRTGRSEKVIRIGTNLRSQDALGRFDTHSPQVQFLKGTSYRDVDDLDAALALAPLVTQEADTVAAYQRIRIASWRLSSSGLS